MGGTSLAGAKRCCHFTHSVTSVLANSTQVSHGQNPEQCTLTLRLFDSELDQELGENFLVNLDLQAVVFALGRAKQLQQAVAPLLVQVVLHHQKLAVSLATYQVKEVFTEGTRTPRLHK